MVAREEVAGVARGSFARFGGALFLTWRHWLSAAVRASRRSMSASAGSPTVSALAATGVVRSRALPASEEARTALWRAGVGALAVGTAAEVATMAWTGQPPGVLALAAAWVVVWALLRLLLFETLAPLPWRTSRLVWALSLLPWLLALGGPLVLAALPLSAWLAWRTAVGEGVDRRAAARAVGIAWGAQIALEAAVLAVFAALLILPLLGR